MAHAVAAALLLAATCAAQAFTLGDLRGAATIGRVLDVSVRVQGGPGETVSTSCVSADLYFADARQAAPVVTVSAGADAQALVRIQSGEVVNEPVVTVLVRATCGSSTMRRYVLLADFPQTAPLALPAPASAVSSLAQGISPSPTPAEATPVLVLPMPAEPLALVAAKPAKTPRAPKIQKEPSTAIGSTAPVVRPLAVKPARPAGKSVLKLDPLELLSDRIDSLDATMLFAPTEDALKNTQQITSLQSDVKTLRELAAKNDARFADLRTQLQQAQDQQLPMLLIYLLLALVLLCLAGVAWLWHKQRQMPRGAQSSWWHEGDGGPSSTLLMPQASRDSAEAAPQTAFTAKPVTRESPAKVAPHTSFKPTQPPPDLPTHEVDLDIDLDNFMVAEPAPTAAQPAPAGQPDRVGQPLEQPVRHLNSDAILDIRQQAEFFVSLGQTDRAVHILTQQIAGSTQPNPLVHLDLLGLYHSLGLKADFREQREVFGRLFNAQVPDFPAFSLEDKDLESYPEILSKLASRWPGEQALAMLDAWIFHDPKTQARPLFDLAAFRDLVLLHNLAEYQTDDRTMGKPIAALTPVAQTIPVASAEPQALSLTEAFTPTPTPDTVGARPEAPVSWMSEPTTSATPALMPTMPGDAFIKELSLAPLPEVPDLPAPAPTTPSQQAIPTPSPTSPETSAPVAEESPSRMLDLDFSSLLLPPPSPGKPADEDEPVIKPPVRYATRARWPVTKKPK